MIITSNNVLNRFIYLLSKNKICILFFLFYSFLIVFFCSQFSPLYDFNHSPDVSIYHTIGKGILFDKIPYKDLFDHKGPLIFFIYALGYFIYPDSLFGMFILSSISLSISITAIYFLSKLFIKVYLSIISAMVYPVFWVIFLQFGGSAEEFILTFMVVSLAFFIYYFKHNTVIHNPFIMFLHGVMFISVFLIKLNLVIFWIPFLIYIFLNLLLNKLYKNLFTNAISFICGCLFVLIPLFIYFLINDAFSDFFTAYIVLNLQYGRVDIVNYWYFIIGLILRFFSNITANFICFPIMVFGVMSFSFTKILKSFYQRLIILASFLGVLYMLYSPGVNMLYYYIIFTLFFPLGTISIFYFIQNKLISKKPFSKLIVVISFFVCTLTCIHKQDLFGNNIINLINRDFPESPETIFAKKISNDQDPTLLVVGLSDGLNVFYLSKIVPNTKYFFSPNIMHNDYPQILDSQFISIQNHTVNFVIMKENFRYAYSYDSLLVKSGYQSKLKVSNYFLYELDK